MISTYLVYNLILVFPILLLYYREKIKIPIALPYILITLVGILRFDIGFDYDGMVRTFRVYAESSEFTVLSKEPSYYILCKLFSFSSKGYIFVLALFFVANLFVLSKILYYYKIEFEGLFVFITMCFLFDSFDRVRQSLAILVFLYSLRFIEKRKFSKYLISIIITFFIHYSAIILLPFYWLLRIRLSKNTYFLIFVVAIILFYLGFWVNIRYNLFKLIPVYGDLYIRREQYLLSVATNSGIGVLFTIIMLFLPVLLFRDVNEHRIIINTTFFGTLFFTLASGNLLLERFSQYFTYVSIIAISLLLKPVSRNKYILGFVLFFWFQASIFIARSGCTPYKTIFSYEARHEILKPKTEVKLEK
jgi:hypothetical protein